MLLNSLVHKTPPLIQPMGRHLNVVSLILRNDAISGLLDYGKVAGDARHLSTFQRTFTE